MGARPTLGLSPYTRSAMRYLPVIGDRWDRTSTTGRSAETSLAVQHDGGLVEPYHERSSIFLAGVVTSRKCFQTRDRVSVERYEKRSAWNGRLPGTGVENQ